MMPTPTASWPSSCPFATACRAWLACWLLLGLCVGGLAAPKPDADEPEVSREEAELLSRARELSATDSQAAIATLQAALRPSANPALLYSLGVLYAQNEQLPQAENAFAEALTHLPKFHRARKNLANVLARQGKDGAAVREFAALLEQGVDEPTTRLALAAIHAKRKEFGSAERQLEHILRLDGTDQQARRMLANVYLLSNRDSDALAQLQALVKLNPRDTEARQNLAGLHLKSGRHGDATAELETLLTIDPERDLTRRNLAALYAEHGQPAAATGHFRTLLRRTPQDAELRLALASQLVEQEKFEAAATELENVLEIAPDRREARQTLAALHLQLGNTAKGVAALTELLRRFPTCHSDRRMLAGILLEQQHYGKAVAQLLALLRHGAPETAGTWELLGFAYRCLERPAAAETAYRNALAQGADTLDVRMGLVRAIMDQGELERAAPLLRRQAERTPLEADVWRLLAKAALESGDSTSATASLECARRLGVAGAETHHALGDLLLEQNLPREALEAYLETNADADARADRLLRAADSLLRLGHGHEAERLLERLNRLHGDMIPRQQSRLALLKGRLAVLQQDFLAAEGVIATMLAQDPLNGDLLMEAGRVLQRLGRLEQALDHYKRAARVSAAQKPLALVRQAQIAVEQDDYTKAARLLEQSLKLQHKTYVERYLEQVRRMIE